MINYLESFEDYLVENEKSAGTIGVYTRDVRMFLDYYGKDIKKLNKNDVNAYRKHLISEGLKGVTINRKLVGIKQFIDFLNDQFEMGIAFKIKMEKQQQKKRLDDVLTHENIHEMGKIAESKGDIRAKTIFYTLAYTGMRVSELLQLTVEDVGKEEIRVVGKGNKERYISIPDDLNNILKEYLTKRDKTSNKLFSGQRTAINRQTVHNIVKKYGELAGVHKDLAHAHSFRHAYCKMMIEDGNTLDTVAELVGHSDINTTTIYTKKTRKELRDATNSLMKKRM